MINLVIHGEVKREQGSMRVEENTTGMSTRKLSSFFVNIFSSKFFLTKARFHLTVDV